MHASPSMVITEIIYRNHFLHPTQFESDEQQFSSSMFLLNQSTFTEVMKLEGSNDSAELTGILYTLFDGRGRVKDIMQWATTFEIGRIGV